MRTKIKDPVKLRLRKLTDGNLSIYLDIYVNGERKYEFLKLYIVPEKTKADKERNKETMRLAELERSRRTLDIQSARFDDPLKERRRVTLEDYIQESIKKNIGNAKTSRSVLRHLRDFETRKIYLDEITPRWIDDFNAFILRQGVSANSLRMAYDVQLNSCLSRAVRDGLIASNPMRDSKKIKYTEVEKSYLTIEEMKALAETPCRQAEVKRAFLFACLTGLRISDVRALTWGNVVSGKSGARLVFRQQKTKGQEYMDINAQVMELLGERGDANECIFHPPLSHTYIRLCLEAWAKDAGIDKHLTFHSSRHTFAVMMLSLTGDIMMVSKLLGHRNLSTTQVYAKIVDSNKRKAVDMIPKIL